MNPASDRTDRRGSSLAKITPKAHGAGVLEGEYSFAKFYLFLQIFFRIRKLHLNTAIPISLWPHLIFIYIQL